MATMGMGERLRRVGPWSGRKYFLDKMTFRDLVTAYFTYYAILVYLALAVVPPTSEPGDLP